MNSVGMSVNTPRIEKGVTEKKTSKRTRGQLRDQSTRGGGGGGGTVGDYYEINAKIDF